MASPKERHRHLSVAATYAEALYGAASDKDAVAAVAADLAGFRDALAGSPDLAMVLGSPDIESAKQKAIVGALAKDADPLVARFLETLVERGRIGQVAEIAAAFAARLAKAEGRIEVEAVTAIPLTDDLRQAIIAKVAADTGQKVTLQEKVDPDLVGGLVLRAGGIAVDASVRSRLDQLRRTLTSSPVASAVGE